MAIFCDDVNDRHACRREKDHPGNHYDPRTQTAWTGAPPPAAMPVQNHDPSAGVFRQACGAAFPDNTGWVICTLPHNHGGYHQSDPSMVPIPVMDTPEVAQAVTSPDTAAIWRSAPEPVADGMANRVPVGADYSQISHIALRMMAETQAEGNKKYGVGNWQIGLPLSNLISHAVEHLMKLVNADTSDGTTIDQHFGHALWNIEKAAHFYHTRPDLIDILPLVKARDTKTTGR